MTRVLSKLAATLLGIACCLAIGAGHAAATPDRTATATTAVPAAAPASVDACGAVSSSVQFSQSTDRVWGYAKMSNSCAGWTTLCVRLAWRNASGTAVYGPYGCVPLTTGSSPGVSGPARVCDTRTYWASWVVYAGESIVKRGNSANRALIC